MTKIKMKYISDSRKELVKLEWSLFTKVINIDGRAPCQDNYTTFYIMRMSQFLNWPDDLVDSYMVDIKKNISEDRNIMTEKYAWMMKYKSNDISDNLKQFLSCSNNNKLELIEEIVDIQVKWMQQYRNDYFALSLRNRRIIDHDDSSETSFATYLEGELSTYSDKTLYIFKNYVHYLLENNKNLVNMIMDTTVQFYGYKSLEVAEKEKEEELISSLLKEVDFLFSNNKFESAEHILVEWIKIFRKYEMLDAELTFQNELIGYYRKAGLKSKGNHAIERAVFIMRILGIDNTISGGTTCLNIGTALKDFGDYSYSEKFLNQAESVYNNYLKINDLRLAALYNNQALLYTLLKQYNKAIKKYNDALIILKNNKDTDLEKAITYINLAHLYEQIREDKKVIADYINKSFQILKQDDRFKDSGIYRYYCETSAKSYMELGFMKESEYLKKILISYI